MDADTLAARYQGFQTRFSASPDYAEFDCALIKFKTSEKQLPQHALQRTLRELATTETWDEVRGETKEGTRFTNLLWFMEKVFFQAREMKGSQPVPTVSFDPKIASRSDWDAWRDLICNSNLSDYKFGRFVRSLRDWDKDVSCLPLHSFFGCSLRDFLERDRAIHILQVLGGVARAISALAGGHLSSVLLTSNLDAVARWVERVLDDKCTLTADELRNGLQKPLLDQFQEDMDPVDAELIRAWWGESQESRTQAELGKEYGLGSRQAISQRTGKVAAILTVRWPEGCHLLQALHQKLTCDGSEVEQAIVRQVLQQCYKVSLKSDNSRSDFQTSWESAGHYHLTPMTCAELADWLSTRCPQVSVHTAREWLVEDNLVEPITDQTELFFSTKKYDTLLRELRRSQQPIALQDIISKVGDREKAVRNHLTRDARFLPYKPADQEDGEDVTIESEEDDENEEKDATQFINSEYYGFIRRHGVWYVSVTPRAGNPFTLNELPLTNIAHLIVGGLTERGIWDASVWGVYDYVKCILSEVYRVALPDRIDQFVLSRMLVRTTREGASGLIRTMRRRRLRWDPKDAPRARGKLGWIGEVLHRCGQPLTAEELSVEMSRVYQTYNDSVYVQLPTTSASGFTRSSGSSTRVPPLFVHNGWMLNATCSNISDGVREFVGRVVNASLSPAQRYAQCELPRWLVEVCERAAGGNLQWRPEEVALPASNSNDEGTS
jgi:hypothetical protein